MTPLPLNDATETRPGQLLRELEKRQDDVLNQLDDLEAKIAEVLRGLNVEAESD